MHRALGISDDVSRAALTLIVLALAGSFGLLLLEMATRRRARLIVFVSGLLVLAAMLGALLRPVWVTERSLSVGARVLVLVDGARRLLLQDEGRTRRARALERLPELREHYAGAHLDVKLFGDGRLQALAAGAEAPATVFSQSRVQDVLSDRSSGDTPRAIVLLSDGRFEEGSAAVSNLGRRLPVHTVSVTERTPADVSVRRIVSAGAAVAHQPLALRIQVGCAGGLRCGKVPVLVRGLLYGEEPVLLAKGQVDFSGSETDATGEVRELVLEATLDRAGERIVEILLDAPEGDEVPENDRRLLSFSVTRDRLRLLHIAGAPSYDVRALRHWLKSDAAIDLVAFFILRTETDDPGTLGESELALIPFPVDELFTSHLPSFDAVILQNINAVTYGLDVHLGTLERYVREGGGLVLVGGREAFSAGGYSGTLLTRVLPVELLPRGVPFDPSSFAPRYTVQGAEAPMLARLREVLGTELPTFGGASVVGPARPQAFVLWEHPTRSYQGHPMPLLSLGEAGDGRVIALATGSTHELHFGMVGARARGRAYGALWDGLLGWLMRDPRYEALRLDLLEPCYGQQPTLARLSRVPGMPDVVKLRIEHLGVKKPVAIERDIAMGGALTQEITLGPLQEGAYSARLSTGSAPESRHDFACEAGGEPWSDSRPDPATLARIAESTGGKHVSARDVKNLPIPENDHVTLERHVEPIVPAWVWTALAAACLAGHWLVRRRAGMA